jgi:undecaprenyl-diphosphatase
MPPSSKIPRRVYRHWHLISGLSALALGVLLGAVIALRGNAALGVDAAWMEEIVEHRSPLWEVPSYVMNFLGGGWFAWALSIGVTVLLLVLRRPWTALFFGISSLSSSLLVQALKVLFGRDRPEEILLTIGSASFPSGHVANAATLAALAAIIVWRWWAFAAGAVYIVLMALSRTYLGAHWLSDTVGGALIGIGLVVIIWAPFAQRVLSEKRPSQ